MHLNEAADIVLEQLAAGIASDVVAARGEPGTARPPSAAGVAADVASFVIEALPVEAFEALLVVTSWIGEVIVDEPPYQLDVVLTDPLHCWCRLDLVPDAGASTVGITIARLPDEPRCPTSTTSATSGSRRSTASAPRVRDFHRRIRSDLTGSACGNLQRGRAAAFWRRSRMAWPRPIGGGMTAITSVQASSSAARRSA